MTYTFPPSDNFPDGTQEETEFDASAQELITFLESMPGFADWIDARQAEINATALSGDLPTLTGKAGQGIGVLGDESGAGFFVGPVSGTVGGTSDALTLTTGLSLNSLTSGQIFTFAPTVDSTLSLGATTITIDGNALTVKTPAGDDITAGYLEADRLATGVVDGANLVVSRVSTSVSGASITQYVDDIATVTDEITLTFSAAGALNAVWTYPVTNFASTPSVSALYKYDAATVPQNASQIGALIATSVTATSATLELRRIAGETDFVSGNTAVISVSAIGKVT